MRRSLVAQAAQQLGWTDIRGKLIRSVCLGKHADGDALPVLSLLRLEAAATERLDGFIAEARADASSKAASGGAAGVAQAFAANVKLASLLDLRRCHNEALEVLETSCESQDVVPDSVNFLKAIIKRHIGFAQTRTALLAERSTKPEATIQIVHADEEAASPTKFREQFTEPGVPCIVRGETCIPSWTPQALEDQLGGTLVPLRRCDPTSVEWAQLEPAGAARFETFVKEVVSGDGSKDDMRQLFDFSIWQNCGNTLVDQVLMPKWFCTDMYSLCAHRINPVSGSNPPTLFLAAKGTRSSLHVDFLQTNFWMGLCHGKKRWRLVPKGDLALLYPLYLIDLNPSFAYDLDAIDIEHPSFPGLELVQVAEASLNPGDIIFVPRGWPHQVNNLETSVAISSNFIDTSNVKAARDDAMNLGLIQEPLRLFIGEMDTAAGELQRLAASQPDQHLPLREFKRRHGETRLPQDTQKFVAAVTLCGIGLLVVLPSVLWLRRRCSRQEIAPQTE